MSKNHQILEWFNLLGQEVLLLGMDGRYYAGTLYDDPPRSQFLLKTDIDKTANIPGMGIKYVNVAEMMMVSSLTVGSYEYEYYKSLVKAREKL